MIVTGNSFSTKYLDSNSHNQTELLSYIVDPSKQALKFYWKDNKGNNYASLKSVVTKVKRSKHKVSFAVNGGMYDKDHKPKGLYIENNITLSPIDRVKSGYGNFYLQPNGVFYIKKDGTAYITSTSVFRANAQIKYATQSGPMLLIDGKVHSKFKEKSKHLNIRNGVGVLPNGKLLFAMSKGKINLYHFAQFFKKYGCEQALYLDGFVSRTYLPSKNWEQLDGNFAVIIAEVN